MFFYEVWNLFWDTISRFRGFQRFFDLNVATQRIAIGMTTGRLEVHHSRSSRTKEWFSQFYWLYVFRHTPLPLEKDRIRTVSQRTKPNSRTAFIGEQPNPWNLLQLQDAMSRHRGAKRPRRYELLGVISLLSLAYLWSVNREPFHTGLPGHYSRLSSLFDM